MAERSDMRLYAYIVTSDKGLAPNPFWGYCTLAVCTLNHMGVRAQKRDWFIGTESVDRGSKLAYAMQVAEVLPFEHYYNDPRFEEKRPAVNGTWCQRCGDNMYYKDDRGKWKRHRSAFHHDRATIEQDLKNPYVFIAERFYYFGNRAVEIPPEYSDLIWKRQGCKCKHDPNTVKNFLDWLQTSFKPGIHGEPRDNPWRGRC